MGRNLFARQLRCLPSATRCARPNITDADWLWGGEPETIEATIREGRNGIMTPWIDVIGPKGVDDVVAYVMSLSAARPTAATRRRSKTQFGARSAPPAGVSTAKGNHALGAPNLTDNVWLHGLAGDNPRDCHQGPAGVMPAHGDRMGGRG